MKNLNLKKENYEKPESQVVKIQMESKILTGSSVSEPNSVEIDDMGNWNTWSND